MGKPKLELPNARCAAFSVKSDGIFTCATNARISAARFGCPAPPRMSPFRFTPFLVPSRNLIDFVRSFLVSKRRDSTYRAGRSPNWIKVKNRTHPAMSRVKDSFG